MDTTIRKQKSADQLAVGDWLAPGALMERPAEVLFVYAYPADADAIASGLVPSKDRGTSVQLIVREQGRTGVWPDLAAATTLFDLASDEDLAAYREAAERAQRIADIRAFADWLEANPGVPVPQGMNAQTSTNLTGDVWNSGAEGVAWARRTAQLMGAETSQDDEHIKAVKTFGNITYTVVAWHSSGRPAEPDADPTGLAYSRDVDDPTPVSGARVEMHTGGVTDEGLVDESDVQCDLADPHSPHRTRFAPETGIANGICPGRCTRVCIDMAVDGAPQNAHKGWHDDECPAVVDIADVR